MKKTAVNKSVDEYLRALPVAERTTLEKLRQTIKAAAPKAEETISYGMPAYKHFGMLVYFAAFNDHCSFFAGKSIMKIFEKELEPFKDNVATIRFTTDKPLPDELVKKIVKRRVIENEEKAAAKKSDENKSARKK